MPWDPYSRYYFHFWQTILHLRLRTFDFFLKSQLQYFCHQAELHATLPHCALLVVSRCYKIKKMRGNKKDDQLTSSGVLSAESEVKPTMSLKYIVTELNVSAITDWP